MFWTNLILQSLHFMNAFYFRSKMNIFYVHISKARYYWPPNVCLKNWCYVTTEKIFRSHILSKGSIGVPKGRVLLPLLLKYFLMIWIQRSLHLNVYIFSIRTIERWKKWNDNGMLLNRKKKFHFEYFYALTILKKNQYWFLIIILFCLCM